MIVCYNKARELGKQLPRRGRTVTVAVAIVSVNVIMFILSIIDKPK